MKKIQIQMFYRLFFFNILFIFMLGGCSSYPNLNECPSVDEQPTVSFEETQEEISEMKNEVSQKKDLIQKHHASI